MSEFVHFAAPYIRNDYFGQCSSACGGIVNELAGDQGAGRRGSGCLAAKMQAVLPSPDFLPLWVTLHLV